MKHQYSEDLFAETRMSFGEHLEDLRKHLMRALKGFLVALVLSFFIGEYVLAIIRKPVEDALEDYHWEHLLKNREKPNRLLARLRSEVENPDAKPEIRAMNEPRALRMFLAKGQLDQLRGNAANGVGVEEQEGPGLEIVVKVYPADVVEAMHEPLSLLAKRTELTTLSAQESFMVYFKVSMLTGLVIASPWVFWHIWAFIAAGLYPHERRYVYYALGPSIGLFLGGVFLCQFYLIPVALKALLGFNQWLNLEPDLRLNEWLGFAILMPVIMGLCFQTPLVMFVLGKVGIFTAADFAAKRKIAFFVMLILAAFAPAVDISSLFLLWAPMVALYELGIILVRYSEKKNRDQDNEEPYVPAGSSGESTTDA